MLKRLDITVTDNFEEPLLGLAERLGLSGFSSPCIEDAFDQNEENFRFTGQTVVSFLFSTVEQDSKWVEDSVKEWLASEGIADSPISQTQYSDNEDWMNSFRAFFQPMKIGENIVVRPPWAEPIAGEENALNIIIDPGMAFGTGTHETTRLCLCILEKCDLSGRKFLDLGAGSGILTFFLLKRGASFVEAIEIDGPAVENLKKNAGLNDLSPRWGVCPRKARDGVFVRGLAGVLQIRCLDIGLYTPETLFDGIVANLTSSILLEQLPRLINWVKPDGWLILSGVNSTNAPLLRKALFNLPSSNIQELQENDWHGFLIAREVKP